MSDPIRDFAEQVRRLLPQQGPGLPPGFNDKVQGLVQNLLARSDLVTREEFEAQQAVLLRTRAKLERLERLVAQLEGESRD